MTKQVVLWALLISHTLGQSLKGYGGSGGSGPSGGLGDVDNPVLEAQSIITDGVIQLSHLDVTTRQLSNGTAPIWKLASNPSYSNSSTPRRSVIIDDSESTGRRQEMLGFGHAWTDSTVETFSSLEPQILDQLMEDLFGQQGNNMGFMRHTIGSSDLSGVNYNFNENNGEEDLDLDHFSLGTEGTAMAKMIAKMGEYKSDVFLFGSPWSYPGWMKQNGLFIAPNVNAGGYQAQNNSFHLKYVPQAVKYFTKYVDAYKEHGVTVNGLTLQNEPLNYQGGYPCMSLASADAADILNAGLRDEMNSRGVKVIAYDHNTDQPVYPMQVLQRSGGNYPDSDAVGWHCYASPVANYTVLKDFNQQYSEVPQFMTECSSYLPYDFSIWIAQNFLVPVQHGASGGTFWVMGTDPDFGPHTGTGGCAGCLGSIVVNSTTTYTKTHDYYMMGQFSRYIRRGSYNYRILEGITGTNANQQFLIISVKNPDGSWAVVFLNNIGSDQQVDLSFTSDSRHTWSGVVPNLAVVTWLLPANPTLSNSTYGTASPTASGTASLRSYPTASGTASLRSYPTASQSKSLNATAPSPTGYSYRSRRRPVRI